MNYSLRTLLGMSVMISAGCGDDSGSGHASGTTDVASTSSSTSDAVSEETTEAEATTEGDFEPVDPEACAATPTAGPVIFSLELEELPVEELRFESYEADCIVTSLTGDDAELRTLLECQGEDDVVHRTTFVISAPPSGVPVWNEGDEVRLEAYIWDPTQTGGFDELDADARLGSGLQARYAVLRRADDHGFLAAGGSTSLGILAPTLEFEILGACGKVEGCGSDPDQPMQAMVSEPGGASILLTGGHRAELPLSDGTTIIIDPRWFHLSSDCHSSVAHHLVAWRLQP